MDGKVPMVFNRNCFSKKERLFKVRCIAGSHVHHKSGSVKEMARDTDIVANNNNNNDRLTAFDPGQPG